MRHEGPAVQPTCRTSNNLRQNQNIITETINRRPLPAHRIIQIHRVLFHSVFAHLIQKQRQIHHVQRGKVFQGTSRTLSIEMCVYFWVYFESVSILVSRYTEGAEIKFLFLFFFKYLAIR